ncbi:DUF6491 family protein [Sphingomonas canadensis]|uniref:DUF6491 family protein n=1 Tax=Sphingomonas canadensis TaxID=1219257 RepID=A0ABW3H0I4_9SPHN|nr:DUF6491 family protein [Sphingomonas canadensis]MCW3835127.1 DUF6491 family protein [Sphingomonas canadensis]
MRPILIAAGLLLAAAAPASQKNEAPEATPDGEAVSCLSLSQIRETKVRNDKVIDFVTSGNKVYRNELPSACPGLGFSKAFVHKSSTSNYCSTDTITVFDSSSHIPGATCGLGKFQPVKLVKAN